MYKAEETLHIDTQNLWVTNHNRNCLSSFFMTGSLIFPDRILSR